MPAANLGLLLARRQPETADAVRPQDKIKENWRSGWGSDGDTGGAGRHVEGPMTPTPTNTDEAVPIYDDEAADRAGALFASALDDDELDRLQVRDLDEPARVVGLDGQPLDDALEALNAGPADDQEPWTRGPPTPRPRSTSWRTTRWTARRRPTWTSASVAS